MKFSSTDIYRFFPSPLAHFADRSVRWLFVDTENVRGLVELIARQVADLLDFSQLTALNRDFLSDTLREQEADLVFSVPFQQAPAGEELLIHILIEHQSQVEGVVAHGAAKGSCFASRDNRCLGGGTRSVGVS